MKAVFVAGPESSDNRLMRKILSSLGYEGSAEMDQEWDHGLPGDRDIVWGRSYPHGARGHGRQFPDLRDYDKRLRDRGYDEIFYVIVIRNWKATCASQVKTGHVLTEKEALKNIRESMIRIMSQLSELKANWVMVPYSDLVRDKDQAMVPVFEMLGEEPRHIPVKVTDQNKKHF